MKWRVERASLSRPAGGSVVVDGELVIVIDKDVPEAQAMAMIHLALVRRKLSGCEIGTPRQREGEAKPASPRRPQGSASNSWMCPRSSRIDHLKARVGCAFFRLAATGLALAIVVPGVRYAVEGIYPDPLRIAACSSTIADPFPASSNFALVPPSSCARIRAERGTD